MSAMIPETPAENSQEKTSSEDWGIEETVEIHWSMDLPKHARLAVSSSQPLMISAPCSIQVHALSPIRIQCDRKLIIIPAGPATPGFARDWLKLPTELKLQILRHNLTFPSPIWPSNINIVTRRELLPYLRMTPDIATIARSVFYQENQFIMQFSSSTPNAQSTLARPPMIIRPQLRRITFLTRLTRLDWQILQTMSRADRAGFTGLVYLKVRCLSCENAANFNVAEPGGADWSLSSFDKDYIARRGQPVHFPFDGVVTYDRSGFVTTGTQEEDDARWAWTRRIEEYVTRDITFMKQ